MKIFILSDHFFNMVDFKITLVIILLWKNLYSKITVYHHHQLTVTPTDIWKFHNAILKICEMEIWRNRITKNLWEMCMNQQSHFLIWVTEIYTIGTSIFLSDFKNRWTLNRAISGLYFQVIFIMQDFFLLFQFISVLGTIFIFIMSHTLKFLSRYGSLDLLFCIMKSDKTFFI